MRKNENFGGSHKEAIDIALSKKRSKSKNKTLKRENENFAGSRKETMDISLSKKRSKSKNKNLKREYTKLC